jgi:hydroxypyruvate isomerase
LRCSLNVTFQFWGAPLIESLDGAVARGFRTVELLNPFDIELDDLERALDERGLTVDLFNLPMGDLDAGDRGTAGEPGRRQEFRAGVERAARVADRIGTRKVNALAGRHVEGETETAQLDCLIDQLGWAADRLADHGVQVNTEMLSPVEAPGYLLGSVDKTKAILDALGGKVGFQLDVYHLQRAQGELIRTVRELAPISRHYQIADAPDRTEPGTGEINYANVLREIAATGYEGLIGCEFMPSGRSEDAFAWMEALGVEKA